MQSKPLPTHHSDPSESLGFLLWRISNTWQREQRAALQPLGLTHTQFVILAVGTWFGDEEPLTQMKLSQLTGSDPMTISQVIQTLLKNDLCERVAHPTDSRAKIISVTMKGRKLASEAITIVEEVDRKFFESLRENQSTLISLFKSLL
jgi:DNA-binding MarR family transcriptional regulator